MNFEKVIYNHIDIISEIFNSQPEYWQLERGHCSLSEKEVLLELDLNNPELQSCFIKLDETYIGYFQVLSKHPKDICPWIGLLMIHKDYEGYGFGTQAVYKLIESLRETGEHRVMIGVLPANLHGIQFWEGIGFEKIEMRTHTRYGEVIVYQKSLV